MSEKNENTPYTNATIPPKKTASRVVSNAGRPNTFMMGSEGRKDVQHLRRATGFYGRKSGK